MTNFVIVSSNNTIYKYFNNNITQISTNNTKTIKDIVKTCTNQWIYLFNDGSIYLGSGLSKVPTIINNTNPTIIVVSIVQCRDSNNTIIGLDSTGNLYTKTDFNEPWSIGFPMTKSMVQIIYITLSNSGSLYGLGVDGNVYELQTAISTGSTSFQLGTAWVSVILPLITINMLRVSTLGSVYVLSNGQIYVLNGVNWNPISIVGGPNSIICFDLIETIDVNIRSGINYCISDQTTNNLSCNSLVPESITLIDTGDGYLIKDKYGNSCLPSNNIISCSYTLGSNISEGPYNIVYSHGSSNISVYNIIKTCSGFNCSNIQVDYSNDQICSTNTDATVAQLQENILCDNSVTSGYQIEYNIVPTGDSVLTCNDAIAEGQLILNYNIQQQQEYENIIQQLTSTKTNATNALSDFMNNTYPSGWYLDPSDWNSYIVYQGNKTSCSSGENFTGACCSSGNTLQQECCRCWRYANQNKSSFGSYTSFPRGNPQCTPCLLSQDCNFGVSNANNTNLTGCQFVNGSNPSSGNYVISMLTTNRFEDQHTNLTNAFNNATSSLNQKIAQGAPTQISPQNINCCQQQIINASAKNVNINNIYQTCNISYNPPYTGPIPPPNTNTGGSNSNSGSINLNPLNIPFILIPTLSFEESIGVYVAIGFFLFIIFIIIPIASTKTKTKTKKLNS